VTTASILRRGAALLLALSVCTAPALQAQEQQRERQPHNLAEKTSEALKTFGQLQQQTPPAYDQMMVIVDNLLPTLPPTSYDRAFLLDIKAKLFAGQEQYGRAIGPWEEALKLSDQFNYFDERQTNELTLWLAQLIFSEAATIKDPAALNNLMGKAAGYLKRHLAENKRPSLETRMFYAQLLYQQAVADANRINRDVLRQAREVVEDGMMAAIQPKEGFYMLLMAILQQENDHVRSAEILELMVNKFPDKRDYWPALMGTYLNIATTEQDEFRRREHYIRAINALERAQERGFMTTPKDNYNLVTVYLTAGQFSKATDILHAGLKNGTIESTLANWRLLGSYYQQATRDLDAIEALKQAAQLFPTEGMIDLHIGEIYRQLDKPREARPYYVSALKKGKLEKPIVLFQLLAYTSMELDDWEEAQRAMNEASKLPEFAKDEQLQNLKKHIDETIQIREENKKLREEAAKKLRSTVSSM
jgi:Tfp pilus assembly protein PilF